MAEGVPARPPTIGKSSGAAGQKSRMPFHRNGLPTASSRRTSSAPSGETSANSSGQGDAIVLHGLAPPGQMIVPKHVVDPDRGLEPIDLRLDAVEDSGRARAPLASV